MNSQQKSLTQKIEQICRHWSTLIFLRGSAKILLVTLAALSLAFLLDSMFQLEGSIRMLLLVGVVFTFLSAAYFDLIRPLRDLPSHGKLARYLEERHPDLEDRLVTAVELGATETPQTSEWIIAKLVADTSVHIAPLNLQKAVRTRATVVWGSAALASALLIGAFALSNLDSIALTTNRILTPWRFPNLKKKPALEVTPGDARLPIGSTQKITSELSGFEADAIWLYYASGDSGWAKVEMDATLDEGVYEFNFLDIREQTKYYVKADEKLSEIYTFTVFDAPQVSRIDLRYKYPKYTGLPAREEIDSGDIWAPEGTVVTITAVADKPIKSASVVLGEKQLKTTVSQDSVVTAAFTVTKDSYYRIAIADHDELTNEPPPEYFIHALLDNAPVLGLEGPGRDVDASMVEEVPVRIVVQDDFGRPSLKLHYEYFSLDAGEMIQKYLDLILEDKSDSQTQGDIEQAKEFSSEHMFYLEDFGMQAGDFLSYYVESQDDANAPFPKTAKSDIYFIMIRPFEQTFTRATSQGGQGGGGGGGGTKLSETQKEILIATWKVVSRKDEGTPEEFEENAQAISESQKSLYEVAQNMLFQMQSRSRFTRDAGGNMIRYYVEAVKHMKEAIDKLDMLALEAAQIPERESLRNLRRAEALDTERQLRRSQQGGGRMQASMDQLAELFEDELNEIKNKYESMNQREAQQSEQEIDEALQKVKDLARRQEESNRAMRDLARKQQTAEEKRRRAEELRRQQDELRRETQQLARNMQQQQRGNSSMTREMQENLRQASSEMNNAANNLQRENNGLAAAKGTRALNRLKELEEMLRRNQDESLRRNIEQLEEQFKKLAEAQQQIKQDTEMQLQEDEQTRSEKASELAAEQAELRERYSSAQQRLESLSRQAREARNRVSRDISKTSQEIQKSQIDKKMDEASKLLAENKLSSALQAERDLQSMLERAGDKLTRLRAGVAESEEEKLDLALNQIQRLRENLESLQRKAQEGRTQDREVGQSQGSQQRGGQTGGAGQAGPADGGRRQGPMDRRDMQRLSEGLSRGMNQLDFIRQSVQLDSSLSIQAERLSQDYRNLARTFRGGNKESVDLISQLLLAPLRNLEAELAQKLDLIKNKEKLFLARDEKIPSEYKDLVEKYYEALSKIK